MKYADSVFFTRGDEVFVNLFVPSVLDWAEQGMRLRIDTGYPYADTVRVVVERGGAAEVRVRIPGWTERHGTPRSCGSTATPSASAASRAPTRRSAVPGATATCSS